MAFTLKQLRYLTALADSGHFGRAAATVNVSQPALSVQIRELEAALGVRLVERGGRGPVITPTGREIVRRARSILHEVTEIHKAGRNPYHYAELKDLDDTDHWLVCSEGRDPDQKWLALTPIHG